MRGPAGTIVSLALFACLGCADLEHAEPEHVSVDPVFDRSRSRPSRSHPGEAGGGYPLPPAGSRDGSVAVDVTGEAPPDPGGEEGVDAGRVIEEADIIKIEGTTLYALSSYRGLVIVDIEDPDDLRILGEHGIHGAPFEMYLSDGVAYVIINSHWALRPDPLSGHESWSTGSTLAALDVRDPGDVRKLRAFDLGGVITDSRMVGDVIYLVANEDGRCRACGETPRLTVSSIRVESPDEIEAVDRLVWEDQGLFWGTGSIHVTPERIYVGGPPSGSRITVVDITSPSGRLRVGARFDVAGVIQSRWQMDEHEGVLRVITQADEANSVIPPRVQTFEVRSSEEIVPLGDLTLSLSTWAEELKSVRFDGDVGYAVTLEVPEVEVEEFRDPLFIIDLTDPARPVQRGELHFPGWLYHLVPQEDRLLALGYDGDGTYQVSLFDTSDLDSPLQLDRESFLATGTMAEDQDRIHKAFNVMPEEGLIFLPYSGWTAGSSPRFTSGVQILEFDREGLTRRGLVPHRGMARRALRMGDRMLAMSDERIDVYDIASLDAPVQTQSLPLSRDVHGVLPFGQEHVVELVGDWWTEVGRIDVLAAGDPDAREPRGTVDLAALSTGDARPDVWWGRVYESGARMFTLGDIVAVFWEDWIAGPASPVAAGTRVATLDVSDPEAPVLVGTAELDIPFPPDLRGLPLSAGAPVPGVPELVPTGSTMLQAGSTILVLSEGRPSTGHPYYESDARIEVIDLSEPSMPVHASTISVDGAAWMGGMVLADDLVVSSHFVRLTGSEQDVRLGRVAFHMDRLDVSDPHRPVLLPPVNVPGAVAAFDPASGRVVTVDYGLRSGRNSYSVCRETLGADFDHALGLCHVLETRLVVSVLEGDAARELESIGFDGWRIRSIHVSDRAVFLGLAHSDAALSPLRLPVEYWPRIVALTLGDGYATGSWAVSTLLAPDARVVAAAGDSAVVLSSSPVALGIYRNAGVAVRLESAWPLPGGLRDLYVDERRILAACSRWGILDIGP